MTLCWNSLYTDILLIVFHYVKSKKEISIRKDDMDRMHIINSWCNIQLQLTRKHWKRVACYVYQKISHQVSINEDVLTVNTPRYKL